MMAVTCRRALFTGALVALTMLFLAACGHTGRFIHKTRKSNPFLPDQLIY